jgi:hypothetical protein
VATILIESVVEIYSGMSVRVLRCWVCWMLVILVPVPSLAADTGSAILRTDGGVWVNGNEISGSTTIFPGDSLETKPGFVANLDTEGSSILIQPESIVKFEGNFLTLEHGIVSVGTSTGMSVHVNCIRVEPVSNDRTQYDVTHVTEKVETSAHKNDVKFTHGDGQQKASAPENGPESSVVKEGRRGSRDESQLCGAAGPPESAAHGLPTKWLEIGGGAGVGGLVLCLLLCKGSPPSSMSPSSPSNTSNP